VSDELDQTPGLRKQSEPDGFARQSAVDDVEGHSLVRGGDGIGMRRDADLGEGIARRNAIPDDGDDVEGHSLVRDGDGISMRSDDGIGMRGGDEFARRVGPGEGIARRD
jgi:hypothetical protein